MLIVYSVVSLFSIIMFFLMFGIAGYQYAKNGDANFYLTLAALIFLFLAFFGALEYVKLELIMSGAVLRVY